MRTKQHLHSLQASQGGMVDRLQAFALQTLHLQPVVHNVAQAIERGRSAQLTLRALYGCHHTKAKPRIFIDLNLNHSIYLYLSVFRPARRPS